MSKIKSQKVKIAPFLIPSGAIAHFKKYTGDGSSYYYFEKDKKTPNSSLNYQCYAPLRQKTFSFLAVGFYVQKNQAGKPGLRFLDWITGKNSPWRYLFKEPVQRIEDDEAVYGIALGPKSLEISNHLLMNFLMASRNWNEFSNHIQLWDFCVQEGIPEERAYIYARDFSFEQIGQEKKIAKRTAHNLNHWPINGDIDFERFVKSVPVEKQRVDATFTLGENSTYGAYEANKIFASLSGHIKKEELFSTDKKLADTYNPSKYK